MVARNGNPGPAAPLLDLSGVGELTFAERNGPIVSLGAATTYTQAIERHADALPDLALVSRTIASRQIRNRGTLVGALALADPSSDALAALGVADAEIELARDGGDGRRVPVLAFVRGEGDADLAADELIRALHVPAAEGPVAYAKAGARNAMARAVCAVCVRLAPARQLVSVCVVGAAPQAVRPAAAEALAATADWQRPQLDPDLLRRFGELVAGSVPGVDDVRGSVAYRQHAGGVLAKRALQRAWSELPAWS